MSRYAGLSTSMRDEGGSQLQTGHGQTQGSTQSRGIPGSQDDAFGVTAIRFVRNASTAVSSSMAITETCDFAKRVMPKVSTSLSVCRVDTPSRLQVATSVVRARLARLWRFSSQSGK